MEAIGRLAGGIAHDFNNLLTAIRGYAELAAAVAWHDAIPSAATLEEIRTRPTARRRSPDSSSRSAASRSLQPRRARPRRVVRGHRADAAAPGRRRRRLRHAIAPSWARARRPRQIEQVLLNLVVNARDAMPNGGTLTHRDRRTSRSTPARRDDSRALAAARAYVLHGGVGHRTRHGSRRPAARIFEPFFTTKEAGGGTGLGLRPSTASCSRAGGAIEVDSDPGRGATFRVYLPRHRRRRKRPSCVGGRGAGGRARLRDGARSRGR